LLIVIIAIFVILLGVIYIMISGLHTTGTTEPGVNLHSGIFTGTTGEWKVEVHSVSSDEALSGYRIWVSKNSSIAISMTGLSDVKLDGASGDGLTISFYDVTDDNKLNEGDYFILSGTDTSSDYQVVIYWKASGNNISGDTGQIEQ